MLSILPILMTLSAPMPTSSAETAKGKLVVVNQYDHSVAVVNLADGALLGKVSVGVNGHELTVSKDGRFAYVPIYSNVAVGQTGTNGDHVDVVDLHAIKVVQSIPIGKAVRPHCALFGRDGLLYVSAELDDALYAVDVKTDEVVARIPTSQKESHMFVVSKDGRRAYTCNIGAGSVSVLDLNDRRLIKVIPVAGVVQRISMSVDGREVFTHDQQKPRIAVIDTLTDTVSGWIDVPTVVFSSATTPDGKWLVALASGSHHVYAIDLTTRKVAKTFDLPSSSNGIYIDPKGANVFVSCIGSGQIVMIDLKTWETRPPISLSPGVDGMAWVAR